MELLADERNNDPGVSRALFEELAPLEEWNEIIYRVARNDKAALTATTALARGMQIALRAADVARRREAPLIIPDD